MNNDHASFYRYWGKASRKEEIQETHEEAQKASYHLLPYHCLDVAAVGYGLLDPVKNLCSTLAKRLEVEPEWLRGWFCFCLALHDLGKFCRSFQNLAPNLSDQLVLPTHCQPYDAKKARHDSLGFCLWQEILVKRLRDVLSVKSRSIKVWMEVVCGHHGQPPKNKVHIRSFLLDEDEQAAEEFVRECLGLFQPDLSPLAHIEKNVLKQASWQLAGAAVLADWLGSDQAIFNYKSDPVPLKDYWENIALQQAEKALDKAALSPRKVATFTSIKQQFDFISDPTPLQAFAEKAVITHEPHLFILEDVTGAGKTEAAMVLSHRLMNSGLAQGLYVGLPTMATANAMYKRLAKSYEKLYSGAANTRPSLVLAHGASKLSEAFQQSVHLPEQLQDRDYARGDETASAYCNAWLADSRKKALLADIGVGTIDQALLGILPAKHQSLRLLGLSGKVLLVDEVHAYDAYMQALLTTLLKAHAAQGGSAILLSATLPQALRKKLVDAYASGRHGSNQSVALEKTGESDYPLVSSYHSGSGLDEATVATRESVRRKVDVCRFGCEDEAVNLISQAVAEGKCICWIRNTVADALSTFQQLSQAERLRDRLTLFHSRFAMIDRQTIESDVLSRFGKKSTAETRKGQVLIATQVVEQSLDLDFDLMVSDLAPVDLLIQRAGRLQRHIRDQYGNLLENGLKDGREPPCLYILSPDPETVVDKNWLRRLLPGTQGVYPHLGQLWLTVTVLLEKNGFTMPDDARHLIEGVYGETAQEKIPELLEGDSQDAEGKKISDRGMGEFNRLAMDKGYNLGSAEQSNGWADEVNIPTRLSSDTVTVALAKPDDDGMLQPYAEADEHAWALSQINLPLKQWEEVKEKIPAHWLAAIETLKHERPGLKWLQVLPLVGEIADCYCPDSGWTPEK